jgi:hypothetical protein
VPTRLSKQTWQEIRGLFVEGWSVGRLSKRFGIPKGTIAPRAARERWAQARINRKTAAQGPIADDPEFARVQEIVRGCKMAALVREAQTAKLLADKVYAALETIEITTMEDVARAQQYRERLWPSEVRLHGPGLEAARRGERVVVSEETKAYVSSLKALM